MRTVIRTSPGQVELNFMWLPSFLGMNVTFTKELGERLAPKIEGMDLTDDNLDEAHEMVLDFIVEKHPAIKGLRDYLDAMKYIQE